MASGKILIVDDDTNICELLRLYIEKEGFEASIANDGETALKMFDTVNPDLILLDIMLPGLDGYELLEYLRPTGTPVIFITAKGSLGDRVKGLRLGADDYIVKPIALPVFYEKVKALIKRSKGLVRHNLLTVGNVSLNPNNGVVVSDGEEVTLTAKEYAILKILLENKNSVVSREKIITAVWHYDTMIDERVLDTHIKNIRKALGENASVLKTTKQTL